MIIKTYTIPHEVLINYLHRNYYHVKRKKPYEREPAGIGFRRGYNAATNNFFNFLLLFSLRFQAREADKNRKGVNPPKLSVNSDNA
jgi:hypothetical protein